MPPVSGLGSALCYNGEGGMKFVTPDTDERTDRAILNEALTSIERILGEKTLSKRDRLAGIFAAASYAERALSFLEDNR